MGLVASSNDRDLPVTYWINRASRLVRADYCDPASGGHCEMIRIIDGAVSPREAALQAEWFNCIKQVADQGRGMLFVLSRLPSLVTVALAPDITSRLIAVRPQRASLCDIEGIDEFSRINGLTVRERQVLKLLSEGMAPKDIAIQLATAVSTVRSQIKSVFAKSGIKTIRGILVMLSRIPSTHPVRMQSFDINSIASPYYPPVSEQAARASPDRLDEVNY